MRISELYEKGCSILEKAKTDNFKNEARWIFESVFDCGREYLIFNANTEADSEKEKLYLDKINSRASGIPVQ